jgi:flagellar basal-body rod protein FlgB
MGEITGKQPFRTLLLLSGTLVAAPNSRWDGQRRQERPRLSKLQRKIAMTDDVFGIHGTALAIRSQRLSMLASNIANAATPNYKARDIDFAAALRGKADAVRYRVPVQPSLDGNTVELPTEQTAFAENAVQYRTTLAFIEGRVGTITRALKGE